MMLSGVQVSRSATCTTACIRCMSRVPGRALDVFTVQRAVVDPQEWREMVRSIIPKWLGR